MSQVTDHQDIDQIKALAKTLLSTNSKWDRRPGFNWFTRTPDDEQRDEVRQRVYQIMKQGPTA